MIGIILLAIAIILWVTYFIVDSCTAYLVDWMILPAAFVTFCLVVYGIIWLCHIESTNPDLWNWLLFLE